MAGVYRIHRLNVGWYRDWSPQKKCKKRERLYGRVKLLTYISHTYVVNLLKSDCECSDCAPIIAFLRVLLVACFGYPDGA